MSFCFGAVCVCLLCVCSYRGRPLLASARNPPHPLQVLACIQGKGRDRGQAFSSSPAKVGAPHSAPAPRSSALPHLVLVRPSLLLRRQRFVPAAVGGGASRRSRGRAQRHFPADAQSATQSQTPQLLEGGATDIAVGVDGSMAAAARKLEALELIEDEGRVGGVLEGNGNNTHGNRMRQAPEGSEGGGAYETTITLKI